MNLAMLERRVFPRTQANLPICLRFINDENDTPANLLDLSSGGAALSMTAGNAPSLGQYIYVRFEAPAGDGTAESVAREELAAVVHVRRAERDIVRVGVRFIHQTDFGTTLFGPSGILDDHRSLTRLRGGLGGDRWSFLEKRPQFGTVRGAMAGAN